MVVDVSEYLGHEKYTQIALMGVHIADVQLAEIAAQKCGKYMFIFVCSFFCLFVYYLYLYYLHIKEVYKHFCLNLQ